MSLSPSCRIQTKIISTLGPSTESFEAIEALVQAGARIFRLNFSHGSAQWHRDRVSMIRGISEKYSEHLAILADLQGPKIRLGIFASEKIWVQAGQTFSLDRDCALGDSERVGIDCPEILGDLAPGDLLLLDDGKFELEIESVSTQKATGKFKSSGWLLSRKGINKRGGGLSAPVLTDKDKQDIAFAAELGVDYLGVSFVRSASDLHQARDLLRKYASSARLVAKIERSEAVASVEAMREIIRASDAIMVARGDLGVEIGDPSLAMAQKHLISEAEQLGVPVITATQMMESMIKSSVPTRAEVLDLSNAILDGTTAVMLSAETTLGLYPIETVQKVVDICHGVETAMRSQNLGARRYFRDHSWRGAGQNGQSETETVVKAAAFAAENDPEITAIIAFTASAQVVLTIASFCRHLPIFAISESEIALRQSQLCRGVWPLFFPALSPHLPLINEINGFEQWILDFAIDHHLIEEGKKIIFIHGSRIFVSGGSNTLKILRAARSGVDVGKKS